MKKNSIINGSNYAPHFPRPVTDRIFQETQETGSHGIKTVKLTENVRTRVQGGSVRVTTLQDETRHPPPSPFFFSCAKQFDIVVQTEPSGSVIRYPFAHTTVAAFILSTFPPLSGSIGPRSGKTRVPRPVLVLGLFMSKFSPDRRVSPGKKKKKKRS